MSPLGRHLRRATLGRLASVAAGIAAADRAIVHGPPDPNEARRATLDAGLVSATPASVALAFALTPDQAAAREDLHAAIAARREREEQERLRTERITYTIDLTKEQWRLLVKHGHDPTLPPNGTRRPEPHVAVDRAEAARLGAWGPLRSGVCELDGVEIDGHEPSDLDPLGGCMWCGKQEIYGTGDDGRPLRYDEEDR